MTNERLRGCIAANDLTIDSVASHVGVDRKTVERWITTERVPYRHHRWETAALLNQTETYLWPTLLDDTRVQAAADAEFVHLYPHRGAVSHDMWTKLVDDASDSLDILVYSGLFLIDNRPDITDVLATKARNGLRVRLLFGDPDSTEVTRRGEEEGIGSTGLSGRIQVTLSYMSKLVGTPGIDIRLHTTILYNSIYRSDATMLVNPHAHGSGAPFNPVIHLQRVPGGRMFDHYQASFDQVWETGKPLETTR